MSEPNNNNSKRKRPTMSARKKADGDGSLISRWLTKLLRHQGVKSGLVFQSDGYTAVDPLLKLWTRDDPKLTLSTLETICQACTKQRFSLIQQKPDGIWMIRANQGHSKQVAALVNPQELLTEITNPEDIPVCIHGTYRNVVPLIQKKGLSRMSRQMVHCAPGFPAKDTHVISGMRSSCEVAIYIDTKAAMADGIHFFRSLNNVILTPGRDGVVPPKYLRIEYLSKSE
eukprot:scaffold142750_cov59-Attheya_sp.AAC.2